LITDTEEHITPSKIIDVTSCDIKFYKTIDEVSSVWDIGGGDCTFMSSAFYKALESSPPSGTSYRYGIIYANNKPVGWLYYQLKKIELDKSLSIEGSSVYAKLKRLLARRVRYYTLVAGNMTLTGTYGFKFGNVSTEQQWKLKLRGAEELVAELKSEGIKVRGVLLKDYCEHLETSKGLEGYTEFSVQPNMLMNIPKEWSSFDDYLAAMKSKYRVRVRRARKKADALTKRVLTTAEIKENSSKIISLYQNVANGAGFNLFILPELYFYHLQHFLDDKMTLTAYYEGAEMVGFYTSIKNHNDLDAHFLGYSPQHNKSCQLYLNMLYDLVEDAITMKVDMLIMSRTAMEIKSSVGAEAKPMFLYMKLTQPFLNKYLPKALAYFVPETTWKARSPFK